MVATDQGRLPDLCRLSPPSLHCRKHGQNGGLPEAHNRSLYSRPLPSEVWSLAAALSQADHIVGSAYDSPSCWPRARLGLVIRKYFTSLFFCGVCPLFDRPGEALH